MSFSGNERPLYLESGHRPGLGRGCEGPVILAGGDKQVSEEGFRLFCFYFVRLLGLENVITTCTGERQFSLPDLMVDFEYKTVTSQYLNSHARWELEVWTEGLGHFQRKDRDQHQVSTGGERLLPRQQLRHSQRISSGQMASMQFIQQ